MPTPDDKYGILTVRQATKGCDVEGKPIPGKDITDGMLQVYDFEARKIIGKQVSVCQACHKGMGLGDKSAVLCGIEGNWRCSLLWCRLQHKAYYLNQNRSS